MNKNYICETCGKIIKNKKGSTPKCCGKPMKQLPLDICIQPAHPENSRPMESEEPCDDGRAG
ncbi:MAG: hypothetical protein A3K77_08125 [Euryarchaeota archaeon RBG_13_31_8]|nr:MAG: hypothetical protein A3K77_08125 [Euryarchaeota archaeon RBG_13_31_8]